MKEIGGYFNLELSKHNATFLHSDGICVNTGRNALEYILVSIPHIKRIWLPYFTCDVMLEPIKKMNISYLFYPINNQLEIINKPSLLPDEYIIATNYFGIKDQYINGLAEEFGERLIVDNAQAFFSNPLAGIKTIYSPRKFVGVPDGGIAYMDGGVDIEQYEQDISFNRCSHLLKRYDLNASDGYADFKSNSHQFINQPIRRMSLLTSALLRSVDFGDIKKKRVDNFRILHQELADKNLLDINSFGDYSCPMVYPYYVNDDELKEKLIKEKIYIATYWPNVFNWCKKESLEYDLAANVLAIPIDQRYDIEDMNYILTVIEDERKGSNNRR
ncbi:hypothetical protein [Phocaeicola sp.]